jgi:hypothetical protein
LILNKVSLVLISVIRVDSVVRFVFPGSSQKAVAESAGLEHPEVLTVEITLGQ